MMEQAKVFSKRLEHFERVKLGQGGVALKYSRYYPPSRKSNLI